MDIRRKRVKFPDKNNKLQFSRAQKKKQKTKTYLLIYKPPSVFI